MAQFVQITVMMNAMQVQLKIFHRLKQTKQVTVGIITVGVARAKILMGVKPARTRKMDIRKRPTTRRKLAEAKGGANDS